MELEEPRRIAQGTPGLSALLLFGSRARGEARPGSDWDFAFLGGGVDPDRLRLDLARALATDAVDLVDLTRASALLRYRVARDGVVLFEAAPGLVETFRVSAATFWCDIGPVVARAHDRVLEELGP